MNFWENIVLSHLYLEFSYSSVHSVRVLAPICYRTFGIYVEIYGVPWRRLLRVPWTARRSVLGVHWKDWCWSWNSNILATWCEELTYLKRPWCWERLKAGEGDDRRWDGWMASATRWTWVWVDSGVDDGQGGLVCCSSWGRKESDTTERLNRRVQFHFWGLHFHFGFSESKK